MNYNGRGASPGSSTPGSVLLALVGFVGLCLLVGAANGAVAAPSLRTWYLTLTPPPGNPPAWVFGPVWTVLYIGLGVAAWLVWRRPGHRAALLLWGWQLLLNAAWPPAFFGLQSTGAGLLVLVPLVVVIGILVRAFARIHRLAALLLLPYLLWICYATYLNAGFYWLNPG